MGASGSRTAPGAAAAAGLTTATPHTRPHIRSCIAHPATCKAAVPCPPSEAVCSPLCRRRDRAKQLIGVLGRPALHAKSLGFEHPATGRHMQFTSELPPDFLAALAGLRALSNAGSGKGGRGGGKRRK